MADARDKANAGIAFLEAGRYEEAAGAFIEARLLDPASPALAFNLGLARLRDGRARDARAAFLEALSLGGGDAKSGDAADLFCNLGLACFELGKTKEAEEHYRHALRLQPPHPEANNNLGVFFFSQGRYAEARDSFLAALRSSKNYRDAWFNLRDTCEELGLNAERDAAQSELDRLERR